MKKILFLIHDLGRGGAEKVLVNLVNNLDRTQFDITVTVLFGGGINEQFLAPDIHFNVIFKKNIPGNSKIMKLFTPKQLHNLCVKEYYDIEISYLEGPSARIISGCSNKSTKLISWIHSEQATVKAIASSFRNIKEAKKCYEKFDRIVFVSNTIKEVFCQTLNFEKKCEVLYNTVESDFIKRKSLEMPVGWKKTEEVSLITVGTLKKVKGYDRLLRVIKRLKSEGFQICLYILGMGPLEEEIRKYISVNKLEKNIVLLGYSTNPYQYVAKCDLFVCSSYSEGFSTAVTESLIVGTPVCTVEVSGMHELLGENNEYGVITKNSEEDLYKGIKYLLENKTVRTHYKQKAIERGKFFKKENTVKAVEDLFNSI